MFTIRTAPTRTRSRGASARSVASTMACAMLLAGCAALPDDRGHDAVTALLAAQQIELPAGVAATAPDEPIDLEAALRYGLANHPGLRAEFATLGLAAADVYQAGRLANPRLGLGYMRSTGSESGSERSLGITQRFTELITMPARKRLAGAEFERVQYAVAAAVQRHALAIAAAWFELAGAAEIAAMDNSIAEAAEVSAELAARFFDAGNLSRRGLAEVRAEAAEARLTALASGERVNQARATLAVQLGLAPLNGKLHGDWSIRAGLPPPEQHGVANNAAHAPERPGPDRLDIQAAHRAVELARRALEVTRGYRYLGDLELGPRWEREDDGSRKTGVALALTVPLFDRGDGRIARAEAELERAVATHASLELDRAVRTERAAATVRHARERFAIHTDTLIPARREIVARRQEAVNFMLEGPFELLAARRHEFAAGREALTALTDYWLARVEFAAATGLPPPDAGGSETRHTADELMNGPADDGRHDAHQHHSHSDHGAPQ